jgi:hypothetical protein
MVEELPPASISIRSPFDEQIRFCTKRQTAWVGYKIHLTETCDEQLPWLIIDNPSCYQRKLMEQASTKRATFSSKPLAVTA